MREANPKDLSPEKKAELDKLVEEWVGTRKMGLLSFLNRVEPWTLSQFKKYFYVELDGKILSFVSGVPIPPCRGWYLVDLFRKKDSPPGSTELLILESMRLLKKEGAKLVSLGCRAAFRLGARERGAESQPLACHAPRL